MLHEVECKNCTLIICYFYKLIAQTISVDSVWETVFSQFFTDEV